MVGPVEIPAWGRQFPWWLLRPTGAVQFPSRADCVPRSMRASPNRRPQLHPHLTACLPLDWVSVGEEKGKRLIRITEYNLLKSPFRLLALFWLPVCRAAGELVNVTVGSSTLTSQLGGCFHNCQSMSTTSWIRKRQKKTKKQTDEIWESSTASRIR